jgi:hypothetical protein
MEFAKHWAIQPTRRKDEIDLGIEVEINERENFVKIVGLI